MADNNLKNTMIELLMQSDIGTAFQKALETAKNIQLRLCALADKNGEDELTLIKIGTILTLALIKKTHGKHSPRELSKEDWAEIACSVCDYAVYMENQAYSEFVFLLYADYIDLSLSTIQSKISEKTAADITVLSAELRDLSEMLRSGAIGEVDYIEQCMWTSLEAIIKLLSATLTSLGGREVEELATAISTFALEYGRYSLYKKEQELVASYLEHQHETNEMLSVQYSAYIDEVNAEAEKFKLLIANAFSADVRSALKNSAALALAAGVAEEDVLDSIEKTDSFFLE